MSNGNACIYRCTNPGDKESNVGINPLTGQPDKIEFNTITVGVPDTNTHLRDSSWEAEIALQDNPKPKNVNPNDIQDMGLSKFGVEVIGYVENAKTALATKTLLSWLMTFRSNSNFPFGRFGLRTDDFTFYNTTPTPTSGYLIGYIKNFRPGGYQPKADIILRLRFTGDITKLGVVIP